MTTVELERTEEILDPFSLLTAPACQREHIPADTEVTDTHFDKRLGMFEASYFDPGMDIAFQGRLYHLLDSYAYPGESFKTLFSLAG